MYNYHSIRIVRFAKYIPFILFCFIPCLGYCKEDYLIAVIFDMFILVQVYLFHVIL